MDHSKITYLPIKKNFYKESPLITKMTDDEIAKLRHSADCLRAVIGDVEI